MNMTNQNLKYANKFIQVFCRNATNFITTCIPETHPSILTLLSCLHLESFDIIKRTDAGRIDTTICKSFSLLWRQEQQLLCQVARHPDHNFSFHHCKWQRADITFDTKLHDKKLLDKLATVHVYNENLSYVHTCIIINF